METTHVCLTIDQVIQLRQGRTVVGRDQRNPAAEHAIDGSRLDGDLDAIIEGECEPVFLEGRRIEIYVL